MRLNGLTRHIGRLTITRQCFPLNGLNSVDSDWLSSNINKVLTFLPNKNISHHGQIYWEGVRGGGGGGGGGGLKLTPPP
jgi:hypothetical protein